MCRFRASAYHLDDQLFVFDRDLDLALGNFLGQTLSSTLRHRHWFRTHSFFSVSFSSGSSGCRLGTWSAPGSHPSSVGSTFAVLYCLAIIFSAVGCCSTVGNNFLHTELIVHRATDFFVLGHVHMREGEQQRRKNAINSVAISAKVAIHAGAPPLHGGHSSSSAGSSGGGGGAEVRQPLPSPDGLSLFGQRRCTAVEFSIGCFSCHISTSLHSECFSQYQCAACH